MQNAFKRRRETLGTISLNQSNAVVLTAAMFLKLYFPPKGFLEYGDNLREEDADELEALLSLTNEGTILAYNRKVRKDRGGNSYTYQNFQRAKGPEGVKVVLGGNLQQFLRDYHQGKVTTNFTLAELVEEAEKAV